MMGRRGLRGRFSFWIGPVSVSPLRMWGWTPPVGLWLGPGTEGGWVLYLPFLRVQVGGAQPWRWPYTGPVIWRGKEPG